MSVLGTSHSLYVHTHHHFGLNDAFERSVGLLLRHDSLPVPLPLSVSHHAAAAAASGGSVDGGAAHEVTPGGENGSSAATGAKAAGRQRTPAHRAAEAAAAAEGGGFVGGAGAKRQLLGVPEALMRRLQGSRGLQNQRCHHLDQQRKAGAADSHTAEARWLQQRLREERVAQPAGMAASGHRQLLSDGSLPGVAAGEGRQMHERGVDEKPPQQQQHQGSVDLPAVRHPCLQAGYRQPYKRLVVGSSPPLPPEVMLLGAPDWDACEALARAVVNASGADCNTCALGVPQPATGGRRFFALAGFYVVYHFLGLPTSASLPQVGTACGLPV